MIHDRKLRWYRLCALVVACALVALSAAASFHGHTDAPGHVCLICQYDQTPAVAPAAMILAPPEAPVFVFLASMVSRRPASVFANDADGRAPPSSL